MTSPQNDRYHAYLSQVNVALASRFPQSSDVLLQAMAYSALSDGKRVRPVLLLAACDALGGDLAFAAPFAAALEMIHAYSLIHDDLPAMDNDILRRGKPTNHVVYGEAMAILAGDGLLSDSFEWMAETTLRMGDISRGVKAMLAIAHGCGVRGMVLGQSYDIGPRENVEIEQIHALKTGALIAAAAKAGARLGGGDDAAATAFSIYGGNIGMAFQIRDDILDATSTSDILGKTPGKDEERGKLTSVTRYGLEGARQLAIEYEQAAIQAVRPYDQQGFFAWLVDELATRDR